ncbi:MAG: cytochrome c oxidase subunit 3 [Gaiellaceae bacterium]
MSGQYVPGDFVDGERPLGRVPRTTQAVGPTAVTRVVAQRYGPPAAWWGWAAFIASEATLFGCLIGTYYYLRFNTPVWPPHGIPEPKVLVPLILVSCLAVTSVPMQLAAFAAKAGRLAAARLFIVTALVVQCGYFAYEIDDFRTQLHQFDVTRNAYSSIYYTLLGADHAHVFVGIVFNVFLLLKLSRGLTTYRLNAIQGVAFYWHAVNLITFFVIGTLLSATV